LSRVILLTALFGGAVLALSACAAIQAGPVGNTAVPQPAKAMELDRYLGRWYEYGRYDASFQKGCEAVTADYSLRADGKIDVLNSCRKGGVDGKLDTAKGKAKLVEGTQNAKLKVSFFGPFYGDYWVLDRADD
jgi:apolipoprotein D and lipocalin family protein